MTALGQHSHRREDGLPDWSKRKAQHQLAALVGTVVGYFSGEETSQGRQRLESDRVACEGTQLYGESPSLVAGERLAWRVPVWLGLPPTGPLGPVGTLDVDTQTGEVLYSQRLLDEIAERGDAVAGRTAPS